MGTRGVRPDVVVMSTKGQVVVPKEVRQAVDAGAGTEFVVYGSGDAIILKKIAVPRFSVKELERIVAENEKRLRAAGYGDENSVRKLVEEAVAQSRKKG